MRARPISMLFFVAACGGEEARDKRLGGASAGGAGGGASEAIGGAGGNADGGATGAGGDAGGEQQGGAGGTGGGGPGGQGGTNTEGCVPGLKENCYSGDPLTQDVGACAHGERTCQPGGSWGGCVGEVLPAAEACNLVDDDCDGEIDELPKETCGQGICKITVVACIGGVEQACIPNPADAEICNGLDDDCDGAVDNSPDCVCAEGATQSCYSDAPATQNVGACLSGTQQCSGGAWGACVGEQGPTQEVCDGLGDEDCDGLDDANDASDCDCISGSTRACFPGDPFLIGQGECKGGLETCVAGAWAGVCAGYVGPAAETCDLKDNDCDDVIDNVSGGNGDGTTTCGVGACEVTVANCVGGVTQVCTPGGPTADICDGIDNDCNGVVDNIAKDVCDGKDNDCDGAVDNYKAGVNLPGEHTGCGGVCPLTGGTMGAQCDGGDSDSCADGVYACATGSLTALSCNDAGNDADGDGYSVGPAPGMTGCDCNDASSAIFPGATDALGDASGSFVLAVGPEKVAGDGASGTTLRTGRDVSLAVSSAGLPYILYTSATPGAYLAKRSTASAGGTWSSTSLGATNSGFGGTDLQLSTSGAVTTAHAFYNNGAGTDDMVYKTVAGTTITLKSSNIVNARWISAVAGDSGKFHLTAYDNTASALIYAETSAASLNYVTIDNTSAVGMYSSIARDATKRLHVAYYSASTFDNIMYTSCASGCTNAGSWKAPFALDASVANTGQWAHVVTGAAVHVLYYLDASTGQLRHQWCPLTSACWDGVGGWSTESLPATDVGQDLSADIISGTTLDKERVVVAFYDDVNDALSLGVKDGTSAWVIKTIENRTTSVGRWTSVRVDPIDKRAVHIAYQDDYTSDLKYVRVNVNAVDNNCDGY